MHGDLHTATIPVFWLGYAHMKYTFSLTCLGGGVEMCVSQSVVVHLELEDSVHIRQLELDAIFTSWKRDDTAFIVDTVHYTIQLKLPNHKDTIHLGCKHSFKWINQYCICFITTATYHFSWDKSWRRDRSSQTQAEYHLRRRESSGPRTTSQWQCCTPARESFTLIEIYT